MSEQAHTPGPWYADDFGNVTNHPPRRGLKKLLPTRGLIAVCHQIWSGRDVKDARLIAAAPDLLEALEASNKYLVAAKESIASMCRPPLDDQIKQNFAAIANTKGEKS